MVLGLIIPATSGAYNAGHAAVPVAGLGADVLAHDADLHAGAEAFGDGAAVDADLDLLAAVLVAETQGDGGLGGQDEGRKDSERGQMGVRSSEGTRGWTMLPPLERL